MPTKAAIKTQTLMAHVLISQLQDEAKLERALRQAATVESQIAPEAAALQQRLDELALQVDVLEAAIGHD